MHTHTLEAYKKLVSDKLGSVGMFLSVPLTMTIKIALDTSEKTRWLGILLGSEEEADKKVLAEENDDVKQ